MVTPAARRDAKQRRLYTEEWLQARRRGGRKRALRDTDADDAAGWTEPALVAGLSSTMS